MQNTVIPPRSFLYLQFIPYTHIKDTLGSLNNQVLSSLYNPFWPNTKIWRVEKKKYFPLCDKTNTKVISLFPFLKSSSARTNPPILNFRVYPVSITKGTSCNAIVYTFASSLQKCNEIKFLYLTN